MNRYSFSESKNEREFPLFCTEDGCNDHADIVNKSGLCLKHILLSRMAKEIQDLPPGAILGAPIPPRPPRSWWQVLWS